MEYSINLLDETTINKLLHEESYLEEPDYSGPEYNDIGDLDDQDFDKFVVSQLESQEWTDLVNG